MTRSGLSHGPLIVGIGGTTRTGSSTERALRLALSLAQASGAKTKLFDGDFLSQLPIYDPEMPERTASEAEIVRTVRKADALIIASPGYHGGIAGMVKNAIDLLEDTAKDERVYFDKLPVGLIVTAYGWQATGSTLAALRSVVHAMRGWPTPIGVAVNSLETKFDEQSQCSEERVVDQLGAMVAQILWFIGQR
ncbi:FMN reductase [Sphingopyxis sp. YR583]|uniref:NADPH-dependent FMN reductase n=1 Tax=Sphingopyxis sp. YR583 TaxID=1881047 RepID=UPI0008A7519D|nr:NADPH-dependent FMN reductase [Sphingopyxis sp. YR583]SEH19216.1 FMN reductase [Sphingopyxis sp. YR583]